MKKQFVTYEIALKLKELGFDEPCLSIFAIDLNFNLTMFGQRFDNEIETSEDFACDIRLEDVLCPLWQQVIDWFREKYNLFISINQFGKKFGFRIDSDGLSIVSSHYWNYDKVREQAILKAIELCKEKKN